MDANKEVESTVKEERINTVDRKIEKLHELPYLEIVLTGLS